MTEQNKFQKKHGVLKNSLWLTLLIVGWGKPVIEMWKVRATLLGSVHRCQVGTSHIHFITYACRKPPFLWKQAMENHRLLLYCLTNIDNQSQKIWSKNVRTQNYCYLFWVILQTKDLAKLETCSDWFVFTL